MNTEIKVKFKDWDCYLKDGLYPNKRKALYLVDSENGEDVATCSVNLINKPLEEGFIHIKEWSENKGMTESLIKAGVIENNFKIVPVNGFGNFATLCKLKL